MIISCQPSHLLPILNNQCQSLINLIKNKGGSKSVLLKAKESKSQISQELTQTEQESMALKLFYSDPQKGYHWVRKITEQLSKENMISSQQFLNYCLIDEQSVIKHEQGLPELKEALAKYQFFNDTPSFLFLIANMQRKSESTILLIVRNLQGQILSLSYHPATQQRYEILKRLYHQFNSQMFLIIIDNVNSRQFMDAIVTSEQFQQIQQIMDLVYLEPRIQTQRQAGIAQNIQGRQYLNIQYYIKYETLQKYNKDPQLTFWTQNKNEIIQHLLTYNLELVKQELSLFLAVQFKELPLLKSILKINYMRDLRNKQQKFQGFINTQLLFYQQMRKKQHKNLENHYPKQMILPKFCIYCSENKGQKNRTILKCLGCSAKEKADISLCPQCFEPFHQKINSSLSKGIFQVPSVQTSNTGTDTDQNMLSYFSTNRFDQFLQVPQLMQQERNSPQIVGLDLSDQSQQMVSKIKLQESGLKIIDLFKKLKRAQNFYKPLHENPNNQMDYQVELENQAEFMRLMKKIKIKEVEMFQQEILIAIYQQRQSQQKGNKKFSHNLVEKKSQKSQKQQKLTKANQKS